MQVIKHKESKVKVDYFYLTGKINLDERYFITKIKEGISAPDQKNYQTNVKGKMTDWNFFINDQNFLKIFMKFVRYLDNNINLKHYHLIEAWGLELNYNENTIIHNHDSLWSGVIYLNSHNQTLDFPEINEKLKPEVGSFALFSSFLKHGCAKSDDNFSKYGISFNVAETKSWD